VGGQVIIVLEAFVEHCLLLLLGHFWQFSSLDLSQTNVFHHASSPGGGTRRKLACSIGSPYSRQALGKSTVEPIFIFNSAAQCFLIREETSGQIKGSLLAGSLRGTVSVRFSPYRQLALSVPR
jgi:hypothetical protein